MALIALISTEARRRIATLDALGAPRTTLRLIYASIALLILVAGTALALPVSIVMLEATLRADGSFDAVVNFKVLAIGALIAPAIGTLTAFATSTPKASHRELV